jgi:hypothetical protein
MLLVGADLRYSLPESFQLASVATDRSDDDRSRIGTPRIRGRRYLRPAVRLRGMDGKQALYYAAIAIAVLIGVSIVVSVVSALLSLAWAIVSGIVTLAILAGLVYVAYKTGSWLLGDDGGSTGSGSLDSIGSSSSSADAGTSRQDRLRQQYVEGQISEAEFERRIGEELETEEFDDIDRELERER